MISYTLKTADWNCPSIDNRKGFAHLDQEMMDTFTDLEQTIALARKNAGEENGSRYILPVYQNMESIALSSKILKHGQYRIPGKYCISSLDHIRDLNFQLLSEPLIQTTLDAIPHFREAPLILEIEAPFSILAALMNPMDLYACSGKERDLLTEILHKIADAQMEYVRAAVEKGVRVLSLADPVGSMNMTGEEYYQKFCGESESYFMKGIDSFLDHSIVHVCKKMSQSLVIAGLASVKVCEISGDAEDYYDVLLEMAENPQIHFTGMTCIHNRRPNLKSPFALLLNM